MLPVSVACNRIIRTLLLRPVSSFRRKPEVSERERDSDPAVKSFWTPASARGDGAGSIDYFSK